MFCFFCVFCLFDCLWPLLLAVATWKGAVEVWRACATYCSLLRDASCGVPVGGVGILAALGAVCAKSRARRENNRSDRRSRFVGSLSSLAFLSERACAPQNHALGSRRATTVRFATGAFIAAAVCCFVDGSVVRRARCSQQYLGWRPVRDPSCGTGMVLPVEVLAVGALLRKFFII